MKADSYFKPILGQLDHILDAKTFTGRASDQVMEFIADEVEPILANYKDYLKNVQKVQLTI